MHQYFTLHIGWSRASWENATDKITFQRAGRGLSLEPYRQNLVFNPYDCRAQSEVSRETSRTMSFSKGGQGVSFPKLNAKTLYQTISSPRAVRGVAGDRLGQGLCPGGGQGGPPLESNTQTLFSALTQTLLTHPMLAARSQRCRGRSSRTRSLSRGRTGRAARACTS